MISKGQLESICSLTYQIALLDDDKMIGATCFM